MDNHNYSGFDYPSTKPVSSLPRCSAQAEPYQPNGLRAVGM